jgi:hypothetical protein
MRECFGFECGSFENLKPWRGNRSRARRKIAELQAKRSFGCFGIVRIPRVSRQIHVYTAITTTATIVAEPQTALRVQISLRSSEIDLAFRPIEKDPGCEVQVSS